jgi:hypothetical protein
MNFTSAAEPPRDALIQAVKGAMESQVEKICNEEAAAAAKRVEERVRAITGQIATKLFHDVHFSMRGHDLTIVVKFPPPK